MTIPVHRINATDASFVPAIVFLKAPAFHLSELRPVSYVNEHTTWDEVVEGEHVSYFATLHWAGGSIAPWTPENIPARLGLQIPKRCWVNRGTSGVPSKDVPELDGARKDPCQNCEYEMIDKVT